MRNKSSNTDNHNKPLPMHKNNILIVASSSRELYDLLEIVMDKGYRYNIENDINRLDNGDFYTVITR